MAVAIRSKVIIYKGKDDFEDDIKDDLYTLQKTLNNKKNQGELQTKESLTKQDNILKTEFDEMAKKYHQ